MEKEFYTAYYAMCDKWVSKLPKNYDGKMPSLEEFASKAEDYLRAAIKKFISQTQKPTSDNFIIDWLPKILQ